MRRDKQLGRRGRRGLYGAVAGVALLELLYGCVGEENVEAMVNKHVGTTAELLTSGSTGGTCGGTYNVDPRRSLAVTDKTIVDRFPLQRVMAQLVSRAGVTAQTEKDVYVRWWDTQTTTASGRFPEVMHCNANAGTTFATQCPRPESALGDPARDPFNTTTPDFIPIGLFNRFDLTPKDGSHCGEYRIVYAKTGAFGGRDLVIFEGALPNPNPSAGVAACCPVAQFWADLSADADINSRATKLENFYFNGLTGFAPVVQPANFGMLGDGTYTSSKGQIRTNEFMTGPWNLREFRLEKVCTTTTTGGVDADETSTTTCKLLVMPTTVKSNPHGSLFVSGTSTAFEDDFVNNQLPLLTRQATSLGTDSIEQLSAFGMNTPNNFNAGESADDSFDNYPSKLGTTSAFATRVGTAISGTGLTVTQVAERARAQSCMGCHSQSVGRSVGPGLTWPASLGFTHVEETLDASNAFRISSALTNVFLPHRKRVLEKYLADQAAGGGPMPGLANMGGEDGVVLPAGDLSGTLGGSITH